MGLYYNAKRGNVVEGLRKVVKKWLTMKKIIKFIKKLEIVGISSFFLGRHKGLEPLTFACIGKAWSSGEFWDRLKFQFICIKYLLISFTISCKYD